MMLVIGHTSENNSPMDASILECKRFQKTGTAANVDPAAFERSGTPKDLRGSNKTCKGRKSSMGAWITPTFGALSCGVSMNKASEVACQM